VSEPSTTYIWPTFETAKKGSGEQIHSEQIVQSAHALGELKARFLHSATGGALGQRAFQHGTYGEIALVNWIELAVKTCLKLQSRCFVPLQGKCTLYKTGAQGTQPLSLKPESNGTNLRTHPEGIRAATSRTLSLTAVKSHDSGR
jgi:hypothetical protein